MKTNLRLILIPTLSAGLVFAADKIDANQLPLANQLPAAVKRTVETTARGEAVKQITIRQEAGRIVYDVELERKNAPNPHLRVTENGELLRDTTQYGPSGTPLVYPDVGTADIPVATLPRLALQELPLAAQESIRREASGRDIAAITADRVNGRNAYAIQLRERGRNPTFYVGDDGTLLRPAEKPPALGIGTMLSDTPTAVQEVIRREAREGEIIKIDRETTQGAAPGYRAEIKDARGTFQIRVTDEGRILENTRASERSPNRG